MQTQNQTSLNTAQHRVSRDFTLANGWRLTINSLIQLFALGSLGFLAACAPTVSTASSEGNVGDVVAYDGPKARLVVGNLNCRVSGSVGGSMADSLTTALFRSNRFVLLERDNVNAIQSESALLQSNVVQEGADLVVSGAITAFEPNAGGNSGTINLPVLGGIRLGNSEAYVAIDLRLIDVRTRRIVNIATVEGRSSSFNVGGFGGGFIGGTYLGGSLSSYSNAPMGQAIAVLLENAVREMAKLVPTAYYRVPNNTTVAQPAVTTAPPATINTVSSVTTPPSTTKTPASSAVTAPTAPTATAPVNLSSNATTSQRSDVDGCIGETFFNGIWKFRVASMESSVEDNYKGYRIVVEFRNTSDKKISLYDVGVSTSSEKLFYLVLGDEQTLVPTDVTSPGWYSDVNKVIPQGALIRHEFFFRIYSNTSKPSKLLVDIDPTRLPKDLGLTYTVTNPSFKVDLTCKK